MVCGNISTKFEWHGKVSPYLQLRWISWLRLTFAFQSRNRINKGLFRKICVLKVLLNCKDPQLNLEHDVVEFTVPSWLRPFDIKTAISVTDDTRNFFSHQTWTFCAFLFPNYKWLRYKQGYVSVCPWTLIFIVPVFGRLFFVDETYSASSNIVQLTVSWVIGLFCVCQTSVRSHDLTLTLKFLTSKWHRDLRSVVRRN